VIWLDATSGGQNPRLEVRKRYFLNAALEEMALTREMSGSASAPWSYGQFTLPLSTLSPSPKQRLSPFTTQDEVDSPSRCHHRIPVCRPHVGGVSKGVGLPCQLENEIRYVALKC